MSYRVLIPTAGTGSRLGNKTKFINKSLVEVANQPIISHIIEKFPSDVEFVIALGHKGSLVKQFLELAYPDRVFYFEDVTPYEGLGSGLGLSVLKCKEHLQQPFNFISCDTIVEEGIPAPDKNWVGYADLDVVTQYRTLSINSSGKVNGIHEKGDLSIESQKPYIGLAGIFDFQIFWETMENGGIEAIDVGESYGLKKLLPKGIEGYKYTWHDTGNIEALNSAREALAKHNAPNILEKENEAIWFVGDRVIKYSDNQKFISDRVSRASEIHDYIPQVIASSPNMYAYKNEPGVILSKAVNLPVFKRFLDYSLMFWEKHDLKREELKLFQGHCFDFYKTKTENRIELFYKNFGKTDGRETINGENQPMLQELLKLVDWQYLANGVPGRFHGDFHFENIIFEESKNEFIFLDWRQDFGGSVKTGDIYYDLAKLLHGLIISHEIIANNLFSISFDKFDIHYDFHRKNKLVECENYYYQWLNENGYDKGKVATLTALIFLNIAALHHEPYCYLLFALGKKMLHMSIQAN